MVTVEVNCRNMPAVNAEILVWARETAGLTREEAARKLNFQDSSRSSAAQKLELLESGHKEPTRTQLAKMSEQYRRPLLTFYLSRPPLKGDRGADFRTLPAEYSGRDEALLDALVRDIRARQSMVRAILEGDDEIKPQTFVGSHGMEDGQGTLLASLQSLLDVGLDSYRAQRDAFTAFDLLRAGAERAGIFVLLKGDLGNYLSSISVTVFRGFSIADALAPFIVINDQDARPAWSFTLLHETVHLLLGQTGISGEYSDNELEKFCDTVASEFLLPASELALLSLTEISEFDEVSARISDFANDRNVSRSMVAYRVREEGIISQQTLGQLVDTYRRQWREDRARARARAREQESGPSFYVVRRHRLGRRVIDFVEQSLGDGELSTSGAARILGVKSRHVHPLIGSGISR